MNADERLKSLQKVYADVLLNTAKEAAARIMASERKAVGFQRELVFAKEEGVRMLIRLKQMMDGKVSEAEATSLSQQRKIVELEAQLKEAEDIVKDLRQELTDSQAALMRVQNKGVEHLKEDHVASLETSEVNRLNFSESLNFPPPELCHDYAPASEIANKILNQRKKSGSLDLPSIILRSKGHELYRNGCTQRVRLCERASLVRDSSFPEKLNVMKHESTLSDDIVENEEVQVDKGVRSLEQDHAARAFLGKRNRATSHMKDRAAPCIYQPNQSIKIDHQPVISVANPNLSKDCAWSKDDQLKITQRRSSDTNGSLEQEHLEADEDFAKPSGVQSLINRQEMGEHRRSFRKLDSPLERSEPKNNDTTIGNPVQPVNDRVIKHTFQRKRKRETSRKSSENDSIEKSTVKRMQKEKENGALEPEVLNLVTESSTESRPVAEVAHQLISLSEKKWRQ